MIDDIMQIWTGIAHIAALIAGAYYGWHARYEQATFYIVCALYFATMLK